MQAIPTSIEATLPPPAVSIVIPARNEAPSLPGLVAHLLSVLDRAGLTHEIILIDDGSSDDTWASITRLAGERRQVRGIRFARNRGKTAALEAGFARATGEFVVIMDADGQNDPEDIPVMLEALRDADIVCGTRRRRLDSKFRLVQSRIANRIRNAIIRDGILDSGCGYQAFRRACLPPIKLREGMHRFLPCLFKIEGYRLAQVPVGHHPRSAGRSNYHFWSRTVQATLDLMAVRWMIVRSLRYRIRGQ